MVRSGSVPWVVDEGRGLTFSNRGECVEGHLHAASDTVVVTDDDVVCVVGH